MSKSSQDNITSAITNHATQAANLQLPCSGAARQQMGTVLGRTAGEVTIHCIASQA